VVLYYGILTGTSLATLYGRFSRFSGFLGNFRVGKGASSLSNLVVISSLSSLAVASSSSSLTS